ncbi:hypothetical protein [Campylobacter sp. MIT 97-5078]|uniref:hypothetical protein n=1 Tax=Campylobacter sp. MIT 97-5078 TaxID=1548153 RepID=UPI0005130E91|nr:hypothetical protein [Campylobacter sp. MIT 97-5078]KGI56191.1 hypothetical protein LR59_08475 [Campylobacter sp. MIT 97-5078]
MGGGDYEFEFLSLDNVLLFSHTAKAQDQKLSLELHSKQKFAKILIFTQTTKPFKLSNLKLLARKYNGLFVSITDDGLGCRLMNLIVTMYLAHISGLKFGFAWKSELNACGTNDLRANVKQYGFDILLPQIQNEEYIFDDEFIKTHSYISVIQRQTKHLARGISLDKIQNELPFSGAFGYSYQDSGMHISGVDKDYLKELPKFYAKIQFSKYINSIIKQAKNLTKHLEKIKVHNLMQVHSYMYLYFLARARLARVDELEKIVSRALKLDNESLFYKIAFLDILLSKKQYSQAEMWLESFLKIMKKHFLATFSKGLYILALRKLNAIF